MIPHFLSGHQRSKVGRPDLPPHAWLLSISGLQSRVAHSVSCTISGFCNAVVSATGSVLNITPDRATPTDPMLRCRFLTQAMQGWDRIHLFGGHACPSRPWRYVAFASRLCLNEIQSRQQDLVGLGVNGGGGGRQMAFKAIWGEGQPISWQQLSKSAISSIPSMNLPA